MVHLCIRGSHISPAGIHLTDILCLTGCEWFGKDMIFCRKRCTLSPTLLNWDHFSGLFDLSWASLITNRLSHLCIQASDCTPVYSLKVSKATTFPADPEINLFYEKVLLWTKLISDLIEVWHITTMTNGHLGKGYFVLLGRNYNVVYDICFFSSR